MGLFARSEVTDHTFGSFLDEKRWVIESTYTPGWGFHGSLGVSFQLTRWLALRAEVRGEQLTFRPKRR
jgi:hypothetical protein